MGVDESGGTMGTDDQDDVMNDHISISVPDVLERIEGKIDAGFDRMNGRVRSLEVAVAVLRWGFGLVAFAAGSLWAVGLRRLFGGG